MSLLTMLNRWRQARPYLRELRGRPELGLSTLFDAAHYRTYYRGPLPALTHFIVRGAFEGCNPHVFFDTAFYLRKYPEVAASGVNPLFHYLLHGAAEGRKPHSLFQPEYYVAQCPEAAAHPLLHFLAEPDGARQDEHPANPHPLFDVGAIRTPRVAVAEGSQFGQG